MSRPKQTRAGAPKARCEPAEYVGKLTKAGIDNVEMEATRFYNIDDARTFLSNSGLDVEEIAKEAEGKLISAFVACH